MLWPAAVSVVVGLLTCLQQPIARRVCCCPACCSKVCACMHPRATRHAQRRQKLVLYSSLMLYTMERQLLRGLGGRQNSCRACLPLWPAAAVFDASCLASFSLASCCVPLARIASCWGCWAPRQLVHPVCGCDFVCMCAVTAATAASNQQSVLHAGLCACGMMQCCVCSASPDGSCPLSLLPA